MKIAIIGTGYVGLVTGACFADVGVDVTCLDIDSSKIEGLKNGIIPIYEPGLKDLVLKNMENNRLHFTTDYREAVSGKDVIFSAVGTPSNDDGTADLQYVINVANEIGKYIDDYVLIVTKSTVPVGTSNLIKQVIQKQLNDRGVELEFDIASNPEFLKEGAAIHDFMSPDRVVVGVESQRAEDIMRQLYKPFMVYKFRMIFMDITSAEIAKYASNAMLATRISFMNDIANLCEKVGADINAVRSAVGADERIGAKFLYPGCGYGGACFPKDVKALIKTAEENGCSLDILQAVEKINERQKKVLFKKVTTHFGNNLKGKKVAVLGLSFKPETDDIREAPSLVLLSSLLEAGASINAYDPIAMDAVKLHFKHSDIVYCDDIYQAVEGTDAIILVTEWKEFRLPNWDRIKQSMRGNVIVDGRNIFDKSYIQQLGFVYFGIGI